MDYDEYAHMSVDALSDPAGVSVKLKPDADGAGRAGLAGLADWLEARAMFVIAVSAVLIISLLGIPQHLSQDGWLALLAGRTVAAHGIPQHDYFTHMAYGVRWVDQQWLAQLLMYEVDRIGGLQLLSVLYVVVTAAAFGAAVAAARNLAAQDLHVLMATLPGAFFYLATAVSIRTQGLAYPLFVATLWLLASEVRSPVRRRRVYWVFPMLVLWGNLHGSVTLGAGLAGLYGLILLLTEMRRAGMRGLADRRAWAFICIPPVTLLATPYGIGMIHYYAVTLLNPQFSRMVTEWKPVTSVPVLAVPLLICVGLTAAVVGRTLWRARTPTASAPGSPAAACRPPLFDVLILAVLSVGAVMAVRNITWFGLALVVLLPPVLTQMKGLRPAPLRRARVNRRLAIGTLVIAVLTVSLVLTRPTGWFTSTYPGNAIGTLRSLLRRDPNARILADVRYADWLIWEKPQVFSGRVAYDTSFELLSTSQLSAIADLAAKTSNARDVVDSYPIWLLDPGNRSANKVLLHRPHVQVVTRNHKVIIAIRRTPGTG